MSIYTRFFLSFLFFAVLFGCKKTEDKQGRAMVDSTGFATQAYQMDSITARIHRLQGQEMDSLENNGKIQSWKTVISPHDDYSYVGYLYPGALSKIQSGQVVLIGVAHRAEEFNLKDKIVFGKYDYWKSPYGKVKVSHFREKLINQLPGEAYTVHNQMHEAEHSLEAIIPFIQQNNPSVKITPVLIPYMKFESLKKNARMFSEALHNIAEREDLQWGKDFTIVISSDAVHYGDKDWDGKNFAKYGADTSGYEKALQYERSLIDSTLTGAMTTKKIRDFYYSTVKKGNYKEYKWTWCGRFSIPFGLLTSINLSEQKGDTLSGVLIDYSTSIADKAIPVDDIQMGHTAPANIRHWVGYASVGYE